MQEGLRPWQSLKGHSQERELRRCSIGSFLYIIAHSDHGQFGGGTDKAAYSTRSKLMSILDSNEMALLLIPAKTFAFWEFSSRRVVMIEQAIQMGKK